MAGETETLCSFGEQRVCAGQQNPSCSFGECRVWRLVQMGNEDPWLISKAEGVVVVRVCGSQSVVSVICTPR